MRKRHAVVATLTLLITLWIVSTAYASFSEALERSRQKRTMADMRSLATGLEARAQDRKSFTMGTPRPMPDGTAHVVPHAEIERALIPVYVKQVPRLDAWGEPLGVYVGGYDAEGRAQHYVIRSLGSDGRADRSRYTHGVNTTFHEDLVFTDGNFFRYPEGI
jgi:general secretion pathway protein G